MPGHEREYLLTLARYGLDVLDLPPQATVPPVPAPPDRSTMPPAGPAAVRLEAAMRREES